MEKQLLTIGETAKVLGVSISTLRRWEKEGKLIPQRTQGNQRRYSLDSLKPNLKKEITKKIIGYARVSTHDQKKDLDTQKQLLELYCVSNGWEFEIISDIGSSINYNKKGLKKLISMILYDEVDKLILTHKDRLLRFGSELIFDICKEKNVEVIIINQSEETSFENELTQDVLEIITVFSAKLYGKRSHKSKKLIQTIEETMK